MNFADPTIVVVSGKLLAETQEAKCQQWMIDHVLGYTAERWAEIWVNTNEIQRAFYVDKRVEPALIKTILDTRVKSIDDASWTIERLKEIAVEPIEEPIKLTRK